ncbi:hypothetical protein JR316_0009253 [Psilocybe cubensis]|uniref:Uncharacterized protein n=1 Tax=Psilocybe cubensis TaxID=181762 RepID=A0ACB8GTP0_PSICU|nr:hypothetical protein JR316_0009253 [Psilocybe cubensis]KAH9478792.1 hypothetical protein JR316_0009253 [Psilocybe cubensis]
MLSLANLGSLPVSALNTCTHYLSLNNVLTLRPESYLPSGHWIEDPPAHPKAELRYLSVRTESTANTNATWSVMLTHADKIKVIKWRCWEDTQIVNGMSFPGNIDLGRLNALKKFSVRMSFGKVGRDLLGFVQALESITRPRNKDKLSDGIQEPDEEHSISFAKLVFIAFQV